MKNTKFLITSIITLVLIIILITGYIIYNKKTEKNQTTQTENNNKQENNISQQSISKLDNTKDWIYDAEYEYNVSSNSYTTYADSTYYVKDIKVPYINLNSQIAIEANNEIKKVFESAISAYNEGINNKTTFVDKCVYEDYIDNNIASVILTFGVGATDIVHPNYYTYNFNLKTGNLLSYKDIYVIAGFTENNINDKVEQAITNTLKKELGNDQGIYSEGTNFDTYNNKSIDNYKESIKNNTIRYFLDKNNKLNIIVTLNIPAVSGEFDTIITIE